MSTSIDTTVVVSTYDERRWGDLLACLRSLRRQTCRPFETVVVVDHNPELLERARCAFPDLIVMGNRRARGLAGARNSGVDVATGDVVAFIDDDAYAEPQWLARLIEALANPEVVGAGGALLPAWPGRRPRWFPPEFQWVIGCSYAGLPETPAPVRNPIGANMAVRANVLREVGGFREGQGGDAPREIPSRGVVRAAGNVPDDTELAIRVSRLRPGAVWMYEPRAVVHHTVTAERASLGYFLRRCFEEGSGKANLSRQLGSTDSLGAERHHLLTVLPRALTYSLADFFGGDAAGAQRAAAIVAGTASAALGFLSAALGGRRRRPRRRRARDLEPASPDFAPTRVEEIELCEALPRLGRGGVASGAAYSSCLCLVRLHGQPLGTLDIPLHGDGLGPEELASRIQAELGGAVAAHLRADGLAREPLRAEGLKGPAHPRCNARLERLLGDPPFVSIAIVTRGRPQRVLRTMRSIAAGNYPRERYEVLVVDTPLDGEPPLRFKRGDLDEDVSVRVLLEPEPGISLARNTGLREASGEFVVFADDDVDVGPSWLAALIAGFDRGERVGAVSGPTLPATLERPTERWFEGFGGLQRGFEARLFSLDDPPAAEPLFPFVPGALGSGRSMAFRRRTLLELGGFDEALGPPTPTLAGEDIEALLRVLLAGNQVVHEPAALVRHAHPRDYAMLRRRMWGYGLGLSACVTRSVLHRPRLLGTLLRRAPRAVAFAVSPRSPKNEHRQADYPRELIWLELAGLAIGPLAYVRSRLRLGRRDRRPHPTLETAS